MRLTLDAEMECRRNHGRGPSSLGGLDRLHFLTRVFLAPLNPADRFQRHEYVIIGGDPFSLRCTTLQPNLFTSSVHLDGHDLILIDEASSVHYA
jgi:hypothetical protein